MSQRSAQRVYGAEYWVTLLGIGLAFLGLMMFVAPWEPQNTYEVFESRQFVSPLDLPESQSSWLMRHCSQEWQHCT